MDVVIVESPAKAATINKYLGANYRVIASVGHVRDLRAGEGAVRPDAAFEMDWEVSDGAEKHLREIGKAVKGAEHLYLATDPDREGEAISWHVLDELRQRGALDGVDVKRIVFSEITKSAILDALAHPRDLDVDLVDAYKARRAMDYLVGFTLSPVLWRKLPGARSAGRVQSVALRLISDREAEIEAFIPREYWSVDVDLKTPSGAALTARLTHLKDDKLGKYSLPDEAAAFAARDMIASGTYSVDAVEPKRTRRNPAPPFTTSTLQQEASRKLGLSARDTMRTAQQLYEGIDISGERTGLITYMRTDGVQIAAQALDQARQVIGRDFDARYLPEQPRYYKTKAKNAQEAHEAVRPTDLSRKPASLASQLNRDQLRLYELIWKRTLASQMAAAEIDQVAIVIISDNGAAQLRATGSTIAFDGFLTLYQEGRDDSATDEDETRRLPAVTKGDALALGDIRPDQHFTEPKPRFGEASLVKELERLGIGRPSTYASIISVLQDRGYVRLENRRFYPEDRGRILTIFLGNYFNRYIEYDFTAEMETQLDQISAGESAWQGVLEKFWSPLNHAVEETKELRVRDVISALDEELEQHLFPPNEDGTDPRVCPKCTDGRLSLKLGKMGPFVGCSAYPDCRFTRGITANGDDGPRELGPDPETGQMIAILTGRFGPYIQLGEATEDNKKPKRASLPPGVAPRDITLDQAIAYLSLPRDIGMHPETGKPIIAGIGRYGPYVHCDGSYKSLTKDDDVLMVGLNRAVDLLATAKSRGSTSLKELGDHPDDGKPVSVKSGRFGPYVKYGRINATIPKDRDPEAITMDEALVLIAAKEERDAKKKGTKKKAAPKKKATTKKKAAPKKPPAKKAAAKKKATKKTTAKRKNAGETPETSTGVN